MSEAKVDFIIKIAKKYNGRCSGIGKNCVHLEFKGASDATRFKKDIEQYDFKVPMIESDGFKLNKWLVRVYEKR